MIHELACPALPVSTRYYHGFSDLGQFGDCCCKPILEGPEVELYSMIVKSIGKKYQGLNVYYSARMEHDEPNNFKTFRGVSLDTPFHYAAEYEYTVIDFVLFLEKTKPTKRIKTNLRNYPLPLKHEIGCDWNKFERRGKEYIRQVKSIINYSPQDVRLEKSLSTGVKDHIPESVYNFLLMKSVEKTEESEIYNNIIHSSAKRVIYNYIQGALFYQYGHNDFFLNLASGKISNPLHK
jgi:hypothetical protein